MIVEHHEKRLALKRATGLLLDELEKQAVERHVAHLYEMGVREARVRTSVCDLTADLDFLAHLRSELARNPVEPGGES